MLCLFDLDGTLIDSERGILDCVRHALARMQVPMPDPGALRAWIGPPLHTSFAPLLDHDEQRISAAIAHYHERFQSDGWHEYTAYPGTDGVIERLRAAGHELAVVTSKPRAHAAPIVASLPFGAAFSRLYGPEPGARRSEKATMIAQALADYQAAPAHTVMIGDRRFDIEGALANGVSGIGVLWGFGDRAELEHAGASAVVATPEALGDLLASTSS
ncbi:MAG: HAD hydrolase-like protein [Rhodanobacter sp.]